MLRPFIIEEIQEREERERRQRRPQPVLDLPLEPLPVRETQDPDESDRGVVIIDVMGEDL